MSSHEPGWTAGDEDSVPAALERRTPAPLLKVWRRAIRA